MPETLDIVKLIEKNPITHLSKDYQSKLVEKIKTKFVSKDQQLFVASFCCFLNYSKTDFVISLDDVWKWLGFARKDPAKVVLIKNFIYKKNYTIDSQKSLGISKTTKPKEEILMTINTFKKLCLKAGTSKADEIHDYYIKLEELLFDTINEESTDLRNQLVLKDVSMLEKLKKIHILKLDHQKLLMTD